MAQCVCHLTRTSHCSAPLNCDTALSPTERWATLITHQRQQLRVHLSLIRRTFLALGIGRRLLTLTRQLRLNPAVRWTIAEWLRRRDSHRELPGQRRRGTAGPEVTRTMAARR